MAKNTTIQVSRETAERMKALRTLGLTYDDVINLALDRFPPGEMKTLFAQWQAESFAKLKASGRVYRVKGSKA
jgi:hypothetical protein